MLHEVSVSPCGKLVVTCNADQVNVTTLSGMKVVSFDTFNIVKRHLHSNGIRIKKFKNFKLTQVTWEKINPSLETSKLGAVIECSESIKGVVSHFSMLLILEVSGDDNLQPIIIQQPAGDGIDSFEWISPVEATDDTKEQNSAYVNSRQLVIFTKHKLLARVYSLDCTHIQFEMSKPASTHILERSGYPVWTLVLLQTSGDPIVMNFFNEGSTSRLLCRYRIKLDSHVSWSNSGKWLMTFDSTACLYGFQLQIFTSLGYYKQVTSSIKSGEPLVNINWLTDDVIHTKGNRLSANCTSLNYTANWITLGNNGDYALIVGEDAFNKKVETLLVSMNDIRIIDKSYLTKSSMHIWTNKKNNNDDDTSREYKRYINGNNNEFGRLKTIKIATNYISIIHENAILLYKVSLDTSSKQVDYDLEATILLSSSLVNAQFIASNLLVVTEREVLMYCSWDQRVQTLYISPPSNAILSVSNTIDVAVVVDLDGGWKKIPFPVKSTRDQINTANDVNDDSSKVIRLAKEVQHTEWGSRLKRNRLSLVDDSRDEVTDTFNVQSGAKRIKGISRIATH
ncbi:hypothetical protein CAAN1_05S04720 [[Candida] anglica]|uniref:Uncharacterized protein n=1 Tax=[Candida] anglica TaxID=148631 RepID=A0ABP0ED27_9ASCO